MARRNIQTQTKRQREHAKREKRRVKDERRAARKAAKDAARLPVVATDESLQEAAITAEE